MKKIVGLLLMITSLSVVADDHHGLDYNIVSLNAKAEKDVPNDLMKVTLKVEHKSKAASIVSDMVNKDMAWALSKVKSIKHVKHETGQYNTYPVYDKRNIVGWRASQQLTLASENFKGLSETLKTLQQKLHIVSMQFVPKKATQEKVEQALVVQALNAFKARAALVSEAMGSKEYEVVDIRIDEQGAYAPVAYQAQPRFEKAFASEALSQSPAVSAGESTMTVRVSGRIQLQP